MKLLQTTTMVVPLLLFLMLLVQTVIASTKCQCPPATTSHSYASSTVSCAFAHSPFLIPQPGQIMGMVDIELLLSNDADIPQTTTVEATQKRISALMNLLLRWPLMLLSSYMFFVGWTNGTLDTVVPNNLLWMPFIMLIGVVLHTANAAYYAHKVIGNYQITQYLSELEDMKKKNPNKEW